MKDLSLVSLEVRLLVAIVDLEFGRCGGSLKRTANFSAALRSPFLAAALLLRLEDVMYYVAE